MNGNEALIGASSLSNQRGGAFLFDISSAALLQSFGTGVTDSLFGSAVNFDANEVVVGALGEDSDGQNVGAAYIFDRSTGVRTRLADPTATVNGFPGDNSGDNFGNAVATNGGQVLVGARQHDSTEIAVGEAHLFDVDTGALVRTFANPNDEIRDQFGFSVAMDETTVIIGARGVSIGGRIQVGRVYVYDRQTGDLRLTIDDPTPSIGDNFGQALAIDENRLIVGSPGDRSEAPDESVIAGQSHVFDLSTGQLIQSFSNPVAEVGRNVSNFGVSVAIDGTIAAVGAPRASFGNEGSGRVDLFDVTTGDLLQSLIDPVAGSVASQFGNAIDLNEAWLLVGANLAAGQDGRAFVYANTISAVPVPAAFGFAFAGCAILFGFSRRKRKP